MLALSPSILLPGASILMLICPCFAIAAAGNYAYSQMGILPTVAKFQNAYQNYMNKVGNIQLASMPDFHRVVAGETLYQIAAIYGLDFNHIALINNLQSADKIIPGQKLYLKFAAAQPSDSNPEPVAQIESQRPVAIESIAPDSQRARELARQSDEKRPDAQYTTKLWGRPLTIGGEIGFDAEFNNNFRLDKAAEEDRLSSQTKLEIEFLYDISDQVFVFLESEYVYKADLYAEDKNRLEESSFRRGESWIYISNLDDGPVSLQLGRQSFRDKREWWWDQELDAIRVHYDRPQVHAELAFAEELARVSSDEDRIDPEDKDVFRLLAQFNWEWQKKQTIAFFWAHQNDRSSTPLEDDLVAEEREDDSDADLNWLGLRALGRIKAGSIGKFYYWVDTAIVRGEESLVDFDDFTSGTSIVDEVEDSDIEGWAYDLGATWQTNWHGDPRLTLGYAYGSGDSDTQDDDDKAFRQTGIQDNTGRFRGVNSFNYYGELLRPELSNLRIWTASIGYPVLSNSSIEFIYHRYRQVHSNDRLRDVDIDSRPDGTDPDIGSELDIVFGFEESPQWEIEFIFAAFKSGKAFGVQEGEIAYKLDFNLDYNF